MPVDNAGERFGMSDDNICGIVSPKKRVTGGPYVVVCKSTTERWALVAFDWESAPHLGLRWFYGKHGFPQRAGIALWHVVQSEFARILVTGLATRGLLSDKQGRAVKRFLAGNLSGERLRNAWARL